MGKIDCGTLTPIKQNGIEFRGQVQLGDRMDGALTLRRHPRAGSSNDHPDYSIEYAPRGGRLRSIGAGWLKNGDRAGDFISMTLDDPDWPSPLYLTAYPPAENETAWTVVWTRPRGARVQDERQAAPSGN